MRYILEIPEIALWLSPVVIVAIVALLWYWLTTWFEIPLHNLKNQTLQMSISLHSVWEKQGNVYILFDVVRNVEVARLTKTKNIYLLEMKDYQASFNETILQHILDKNYLPVILTLKPKRKILQKYKPGVDNV